MAGDSVGKLPERREDLTTMLRDLGREEILEILSEGLCLNCEDALCTRVKNLVANKKFSEMSISNGHAKDSNRQHASSAGVSLSNNGTGPSTPQPTLWGSNKGPVFNSSPASVNSKKSPISGSGFDLPLNDGLNRASSGMDDGMTEEEKERIRMAQVGRKKDFSYMERVDGKQVNVVKGLELHTRVFNAEEQSKIVECVYNLQRMGQMGQLRKRTYTEPRKWMRGKGRVTIQFGCCYNYSVDKDGNPPGIIRDEEVDPLPPLFKQMIKRMVRCQVLPTTAIPDSSIVNIYDEGDCISPHIDHHDFIRPFCTVSFLTECNILFGTSLKVINPGEFSGPVSIPLPVGSVLVLNGNGADVAKHCVPGVPSKRISITFRKMDNSKLPYEYVPDPELARVRPLVPSSARSPVQAQQSHDEKRKVVHEGTTTPNKTVIFEKDDFPALGSSNHAGKQRSWRR